MVIQFKRPKPKVLTVGELLKINQRIKELSEIIDLCGDNDDDVLDNLERELDELDRRLKSSADLLRKV